MVIERTRFEGTWWVPEESSKRYGGTLEFDPQQGLSLSVLGEIASELRLAQAEPLPVVLGSTGDGRESKISLLWCGARGRRMRGDSVRQSYVPEVAILGEHFSSPDPVRISAAQVGFTLLDEFLDRGGFELSMSNDESGAFSLSYKSPTFERASVPGAEISFEAFCPELPWFGRSFPLEEVTRLTLEFHDACAPDELRMKWLWMMQNFLSFATDASAAVTSARARIDSTWCELLFKRGLAASPTDRMPHEMLFRYGDIEGRLENVLQKWLERYSEIGVVLDLTSSLTHGKFHLLESQFLAAVQAAEGYQRITTPVSETDRKEHQRRVEAVLACAPDELRKWLKRSLTRRYEPSLEDRLRQFFGRLSDDLLARMGGRQVALDNARKIADWRNQLAHAKAPIGEEWSGLFVAKNQLLVGLKANLLLDLGFTNDEVCAMVRRTRGVRDGYVLQRR